MKKPVGFLIALVVLGSWALAQTQVGCGQTAGQAPLANLERGSRITLSCPANCPTSGGLWGSDIYTDDSQVCLAARHFGAIGAAGGTFDLMILEGQLRYKSSTRFGVASATYESWQRSFVIIGRTASITNVSCDTQPNQPPFSGLAVGAQALVACPANCPNRGRLWGSDIYTDDSQICLAALHSGVIGASGGTFWLSIVTGQSSYKAVVRNGVSSAAFGAWSRSFSLAPYR